MLPVLVIALMFLFDCDEVIQNRQDLEKYSELQFFFNAAGEFKDGKACLDVGSMWLTFEAKESTDAETFFANLNENALRNGWQSEKMSENEWSYTREIQMWDKPAWERVNMKHQLPTVTFQVWRTPISP